jgi:glycosyltransferase involved in cell wall biosynthesis
MRGGPLTTEYAAVAPTLVLTEASVGRSPLLRSIGRAPLIGPWLKQLWHEVITPRVVEQQPSVIYANTVGTARLLRQVAPGGVPVIVHVHEMERAVQIAAGKHGIALLKTMASRFIAASSPVRQNLIDTHCVDPSLIELVPAFITVDETIVRDAQDHRLATRHSLGIPADALVVGGCGGTDWRKGADLFADMAIAVHSRFTQRPVHFVWVGEVFDDDFSRAIVRRVQEAGLSGVYHLPGTQMRPVEFFCGFDLFALSSREDPMPLAALEAASVGKPIVCFKDGGGTPDVVGTDAGRIVESMTGEAMASAVVELLSSPSLLEAMGRRAQAKVRRAHLVDTVAPLILNIVRDVAAPSHGFRAAPDQSLANAS